MKLRPRTLLNEVSKIAELGSIIFAVKGDLANEDSARGAVGEAVEKLGGAVDYLVLNAGIGVFGPLAENSMEQWRGPFETNLFGHVAFLQEAKPAIRFGGSVVVISSGSAHDPLEGLSAYGASKAALNQMAMVLAQEWGPSGIRVNVVSPGSTAKEPVDQANLNDKQKQLAAQIALRRIGTADDVADVVLFFVSDLSSFVTGQWVRVNGGRV